MRKHKQHKHKELAAFLERENLSQAALAERLSVSRSLVNQWMDLRTRITAEYAMKIEQVTKGRLTRADLRPDIFSESVASES